MASEEDYVNQLLVLQGEFQQQCEIAACSLKPPLSLEQCVDIFRNWLVMWFNVRQVLKSCLQHFTVVDT